MKQTRRLLTAILAVVMVLGCVPAWAADDAEKSVQVSEVYLGKPYNRASKIFVTAYDQAEIPFQFCLVETGDGIYPAFALQCEAQDKVSAGDRLIEKSILDVPECVTRFLDYFCYKFEEHSRLHAENPTIPCTPDDLELLETDPDMWSSDALRWIAVWFQTVVYLWQTGVYNDINDHAQQLLLANERDALILQVYGITPAKAGEGWTSLDSVNAILQATDPASGWISSGTYAEYCAEGSGYSMIVPAQNINLELPVIGATGYALTDLPLFAEAALETAQDTVPAGTAFTVLSEVGRGWKVEGAFGTGWLDHTCCMINLPDVLPSIVYNIANGYSSIFRSAGHDLPGITGAALYTGKVWNERLGREEFLAPVLYAMAKKIGAAQAAALSQGDTLVLYEGYRPYSVQTAVSRTLSRMTGRYPDVFLAVNEGGWGEEWFIAQGISNHQKGYAIDVSLARITDCVTETVGGHTYTKAVSYEEYGMPCAVHELSTKAITFQKPVESMSETAWREAELAEGFTDGAKKLQDYCTNAGLTPLASEWWHFNDLKAFRDTGGVGTGEFEIKECLSKKFE